MNVLKLFVAYILGILSVTLMIILPIQGEAIGVMETQTPEGFSNNNDMASPASHIEQNQIKVTNKNVELDLQDAKWATFKDTKSMLPVLDKDTYALQIEPTCPEEIQTGDIVSYKSNIRNNIIIHRVIDKGEDDKGIYYTLQGDNNESPDPERVRCDQIDRKVVAIIY